MDKIKIEELITLLKENDLIELDVQYSESERIKIVRSPVLIPAPIVQNTPMPVVAAAVEPVVENEYDEIKSPIVGTLYRKPSPDADPFVKIGDHIEKGQVVCLIEAMKIFNEIKSDISGKVVKVCVEDGQPIEYDHPLFLLDPKG